MRGHRDELSSSSANARNYHSCFPGAAPCQGFVNRQKIAQNFNRKITELLARPERFELPTPRFVVWCSIQLSYGRFCRRRRDEPETAAISTGVQHPLGM